MGGAGAVVGEHGAGGEHLGVLALGVLLQLDLPQSKKVLLFVV